MLIKSNRLKKYIEHSYTFGQKIQHKITPLDEHYIDHWR